MKLQIFSQNQKRNNILSKLISFFPPFIVFHIQEDSMLPFLKNGDKILVSRIAYLIKRPHLKEVVIINNPKMDAIRKYLIKRIDRIQGDKIYLLGDNRQKSHDSRDYGWVDKKMIVGKMISKL